LGRLVFVGLGLHDEGGLSLRGLEVARAADAVFMELYTSPMPGLDLKRLERLLGRRVRLVSRRVLEDGGGEPILEEAERGVAVLLVPGDPFIATTHVDLRIRAEKRGIKTGVIHGASIMSAAIGISGLQNYRFGRTVTIPYPEGGVLSETPLRVIRENRSRDLHTLCLLDVKAEEGRYMSVGEALRILLRVEESVGFGAVTPETLAVGVARAGSQAPVVRADSVKNLLRYDFGEPPHTLIFPASLHFVEADALITIAGAPEWVRRWLK